MKNRLKTRGYTCQSLWIAGRRDSTVFGVVNDTTTTKFANHACAVHGISLPVVIDKVVVVVLKFPNSKSSIPNMPHFWTSYRSSARPKSRWTKCSTALFFALKDSSPTVKSRQPFRPIRTASL